MKVYPTEAIRNLSVIGHGDAGKTQLLALFSTSPEPHRAGVRLMKEPLLPTTKKIPLLGKLHLNTALAHLEHRDTKLNFIDTPGYAAFIAHARPALRVADCAIAVVDGVKGVEVQTEKTLGLCQRVHGPAHDGDHQTRQRARRFWRRAGKRAEDIQ